jgi:TRAP-type C4-dicarboxylate transport system permease small subunit
MRSTPPPSTLPGFFHLLGRGYHWLVPALGLVAGGIFGLMAFFIGIDMLMRNLAGKGIGWIIELMEYVMFVATTLAAPWVLREGGHVSVDVVSAQLPARWASRFLKVSTSLGMLICATVFYYSASATWQAYERGSMVIKSFIFPEWWINTLVPLCMLLMVVEFAMLFRAASKPPSATPSLTPQAG